MNQKNKMSIQTMALGAVLTALVVVLQLLGTFVRFGPFQISLVLVPIVIGAAAGGQP
jgi:thiamine transporter ThiT